MLKLFTRSIEKDNRNLEDTAYTNILPKMKREISTTVKIHKKRKRVVSSGDVIVRLLKSITETPSDTIEDYVRKNTEYMKMSSRTAGLTGMQSKGKVFKDLLMNNEYAMFLYITEIESFSSLQTWQDDWKNLSPITVHYTSSTDLSMNLPSDYENVLETYSLYSLNIPMLLVQYRQYVRERRLYNLPVVPAKFVAGYVYPNMIPRLYDQALVNRSFAVMNNELVEEFGPNYPGIPLDFTSQYDKLASKTTKSKKKGYTFTRYLNTMISTTDFSTSLYRLPDMYMNPNVMTAFHFGTSDIIRKLLTSVDKKTLKLEKVKIHEYLLFLKAISSNATIGKIYPPQVKRMISFNTEDILQIVKGLK